VGDEQVVAQHANTGDDGSLGKRDDKLGDEIGNQRTNIHQRLVNLVKST
jgi:hypothetical protein